MALVPSPALPVKSTRGRRPCRPDIFTGQARGETERAFLERLYEEKRNRTGRPICTRGRMRSPSYLKKGCQTVPFLGATNSLTSREFLSRAIR